MYFNTEDVSIYYEKYGNNEKTILILPGWGNTRETFKYIIDYFQNDYTIYIIDYPGFGKSIIPNKDLTIYDYTNIIRDFMKEEKMINPIILAHSFGGRIATLLTGYYKEKIDKLIMIDIASIKPKKTLKQLIKEKLYKALRKLGKILPKKHQNKFNKKLINIFGSKDYKDISENMQQTFKNIVNEDLKEHLKYIKSEALIIWGKLDEATPLKDGLKINSLIENSAIIIYPNASHFSYLEYPYLTNKIIEKFINQVEKISIN